MLAGSFLDGHLKQTNKITLLEQHSAVRLYSILIVAWC